MSSFISRIIWACPHQFSWPRREESGAYYQLCLVCGSKYQYDWKQMRRTARIEEEVPQTARQSHRKQKQTWTPRERRHTHVVPVAYRLQGNGEWLQGTSENLSRSGLLFRSDAPVEAGSAIDVQLEMPRDLTGEAETKVTCKAKVARVTHVEATSKTPQSFLIACAIDDYDFGKKAVDRAKDEFERRRQAAKAQVHYFPRAAKK